MHCKEEELILKTHGRLSGLRAWRTNRHLSRCEPCQRELARLESLGAGLRALTATVPSSALDARVQSLRPKVSHGERSLPRVRVPAPLVGAIFGLMLGAMMYQSHEGYSVTARARVSLRNAPDVFEELAPAVLADYFPQGTWDDGEGHVENETWEKTSAADRGTGTVTLVVEGVSKARAKEALEGWIEQLHGEKRLGQLQESNIAVQFFDSPKQQQARTYRRNGLLLFGVLGLLAGGLYALLRLIGPWIPGGLWGCLSLGVLLGLCGIACAIMMEPARQYEARGSLKVTSLHSTGNDNSEESDLIRHLLERQHQSTSLVPGVVEEPGETGASDRFQLVCSWDKATVEDTVRNWQDVAIQSGAWRVLGYRVEKVGGISVAPEPVKDHTSIWGWGIGLGLVAGAVMGLAQKNKSSHR